jgi:hypothetical protein
MYGVSRKLWGYWTLSIFLLWAAHSYGQAPTPGEFTNKPKQQSTNPQKNPTTLERGTEKNPLFIKMLPPSENEKPAETATKQEHGDSADWWWDRSPEIILSIATLGLWIATYLLYRATRELVTGADNTAKRQLRAYISVKEDDHEPIRDVSLPDNPSAHFLDIHILIKNVGQTPAFKLTQWTKVHTGKFITQLPSFDAEPSPGVYMPPGMEMACVTRIDTPWTRQMIEMDTGDGMCLHVWGEIHYLDSFDTPRFVKFRFVKRHGDTGKALECYPEGNDAN